MNQIPKPIAVTRDTVVLTRSAWKSVVAALEDARDISAVKASLQRARTGRNDGLSAALYRRIRAGEHPVRAWRKQRKLSLEALAQRAGVSPGRLDDIETGREVGAAAVLRRLAKALTVDIDELTSPRES